jgi:NADPH:quinone reductase-like Zn-dependent oxidoreductase
MRALVLEQYGIDALELRDVPTPTPVEDEVLVRVRASSVNIADYYGVTGMIAARVMGGGMRAPKVHKVGTDFAGTVEVVGAKVTKFKPGDDVFGGRTGSMAEYITVPADRAIARKPANVSFEETGGVGIAGITALQGLRDHARVSPGQRVLIEGASGGVGTFAVQIAKAFDTDVTAVCSTDKVDTAQSLGADRVIDYKREDFTRSGENYDAVIAVQSGHSWAAYRRILKADGALVLVGAPKGTGQFGPLAHLGRMWIATRIRRTPTYKFFVAKLTGDDVNAMGELLATGQVKTLVERTYPLAEARDAFRYIGDGHVRGKLIVTM